MSAAVLWMSMASCGLAEDRPDPTPVPIVGTVLDADRMPAAGVGVFYAVRSFDGGPGAVVARAESDAQGRFRLEVPGAPGGGAVSGVVWAYRAGAMAAARPLSRGAMPADVALAMVLDPPAMSEFLVRGPDGRPISGARIRPRSLHRDSLDVPDVLADRIAEGAVTDARGRAVVGAFFPEEIARVIVSAPGLGHQRFDFDVLIHQRARTIDLRPVGRVEGRLVEAGTNAAGGRKLGVFIRDASPRPGWLARIEVALDDHGCFEIPETPAGWMEVLGSPAAGSARFLQSPRRLKVEPGRTTRVEIESVEGVTVQGRLREERTGRPIAGVAVRIDDVPGSTARSDAAGRLEILCPRVPSNRVFRPDPEPEGWAVFPNQGVVWTVLVRETRAVIPTIGLARGGIVRGTVVDERGEPVPGASVRASCPLHADPEFPGRGDRHGIAGARGEFRIHDLPLDEEVALLAIAPDGRRTPRLSGFKAGGAAARLVLDASGLVSLAGRVVDDEGHRIDGARVHLRGLGTDVRQISDFGDPLVPLRGGYVITTNATGWFRTPSILDPKLGYTALVEADGFEPSSTPPIAGDSRRFPEVVLRRRRGIRGDRPISGHPDFLAIPGSERCALNER